MNFEAIQGKCRKINSGLLLSEPGIEKSVKTSLICVISGKVFQ